MEIKTLFDVNNLVQHKYQRSNTADNILICFEVMQIDVNICYGGVQVFYHCRPLHRLMTGFGENRKTADITAARTVEGEYATLREDELKAAPDDVIAIVLNKE